MTVASVSSSSARLRSLRELWFSTRFMALTDSGGRVLNCVATTTASAISRASPTTRQATPMRPRTTTIIASPDHPEAHPGAAAAARVGMVYGDDVAGSKAHQRLTIAHQVGEHQLTLLAGFKRQRRRALGIDQFRMQHITGEEMQMAVVLALGGDIGEHIRDAVVGVAWLHPPGFPDPVAQAWVIEPGLAAEQPQLQPQVARVKAGKLLFDDALQHRRVGRRAGNCIDADFADCADQKLAAADPEGNHRCAGSLQGQMVGHAAHPQLIIEAMDDRIAATPLDNRDSPTYRNTE